MKIVNFAAWKKSFMQETDPKTGSKLSVQIDDCHKNKLGLIRFMDEIEGIQYLIVFRSEKKKDSVILFDKLDDFEDAQNYSIYHSWPQKEFLENILVVNGGHATLRATFPYSKENIQKFRDAGMPLDSSRNANYDGRPI